MSVFLDILYIFLSVLVLLFMVTIHEFGHYISGKLLGFKINEFAIGFGPKLFSHTKKNGEKFSLRLVPLGGYCAFDGEDENSESTTAFNNQKPWKRLIVLFSGAFMNFMTALLIIIVVFLFAGMYFPKIQEVLPDTGSEQVSESVNLKAGDILLEVDGHFLYLNGDLSKALAKVEDGKVFTIRLIRDGEEMQVEAFKRAYNVKNDKDQWVPSANEGLGILQGYASHHFGFFESIGRGFLYSLKMGWAILGALGQLLTGALGLRELGGPITTIGMTAQIARSGFRNFMDIVSMIGVNLAVFNLLPIPALDGSRMVFTVIEWIRGKPINRKVEAGIHAVGLILLFGFVILADFLQLFVW